MGTSHVDGSESALEVRVLGPLRVIDGGQEVELRGDRIRALLAVLTERSNDVVPADVLADALWGDDQPPTARASLRMHTSRLRQRLGPATRTGVDIVSQATGYRLVIPRGAVDAKRFEDLVGRGRSALAADRPDEALAHLDGALALWRGQAFADIDVVALAEAARHLDRERLNALELRFSTHLALGRAAEILPDIESAVAAHPERERFTAQLMLALYRSGRQAEALAAFQRQRQWLADELGLIPTSELSDLEGAILRQDPSLDLATPPVRADAPRKLPPSIQAFRRHPVVGREDLIERLADRLSAETARESGSFIGVVGPSGIGKSRVLAEVTAKLFGQGAVVLHGWGRPGPPVPFGALRTLVASWVDDRAAVGDAARSLLDLMGTDRDLGDQRRLRLYAHLDTLVDAVADDAGPDGVGLLVLDDLHWADSLTLDALSHLARRCTPGVGLMIGARTGEPATAWLDFAAELSTLPSVELVELRPLGLDAIAELVARRDAGGTARAHRRAAETLLRATHGNPFYVQALLEDGAGDDHGTDFALDAPKAPVSVAAALERRVTRLPEPTLDLVRSAAVVGPVVQVELLSELAGRSPGEVEARLRPAVAGGVLVDEAGRGTTLSFEHELLRREVLEGLAPGERRERHLAVAEALRARGTDPITLAYHLHRAGALANADDVIEALVRAGETALHLTAWDEARTIVTAALERGDAQGLETGARIILLTQLGRARMGIEGRAAAMATFEEALDLAVVSERLDLVEEILLAASRFYAAIVPGDPVLSLFERALGDELGGHIGVAALAEVVVHRATTEGATHEVTALFERLRLEDPACDTIPEVARAAMFLEVGRPDAAAGLAAAGRLLALAERTSATSSLEWLDATLFLIGFHLLAGEVDPAASLVDDFERRAEEAGYPVFLWLASVVRSDLALQEGRFDDAAEHVGRALAYGQEHQVPDAVASYGMHVLFTELTRGDPAPLRPVVEEAIDRYPDAPVYHAALAAVDAESHDLDSARAGLDGVTVRLEGAPPSMTTTMTLALAAWAAVEVGDPALSACLVPFLRPWSGTVPRTALVGAALGPMDRTLGRLLCQIGERDAGLEHLRRAVALADRMGARPWSAWCRYDLAVETPDEVEARALIDDARTQAEGLGLAPLLRRLEAS